MTSADRRSVTISNDTAQLSEVRALVSAGLQAGGFPAVLWNRVTIAVDEAVTNIVEHAFVDVEAGKGSITVTQIVTPEEYKVEIVDDGMIHYDPNRHPTVDLEEHVAAGKPDGLGVFIMRRIMDVVDYSYHKDIHNRLIMMKRANGESDESGASA